MSNWYKKQRWETVVPLRTVERTITTSTNIDGITTKDVTKANQETIVSLETNYAQPVIYYKKYRIEEMSQWFGGDAVELAIEQAVTRLAHMDVRTGEPLYIVVEQWVGNTEHFQSQQDDGSFLYREKDSSYYKEQESDHVVVWDSAEKWGGNNGDTNS